MNANKVYLLLLIVLNSFISISQNSQGEINNCIQEIRTIEFEDEDFFDLDCIGESIGDAKIVMLGEHQHGDGTTLKAKNRLIKYLHEEKGFNIILNEFDMYSMVKTNEMISKGEDPIIAFLKPYDSWSDSKNNEILIDFVSSTRKDSNILKAFGLDIATNYHVLTTAYLKDLFNILNVNGNSLYENKAWKEYSTNVIKLFYQFNKDSLKLIFPRLEESADSIILQLSKLKDKYPDKTEDFDLWIQLIKSNLGCARWLALRPESYNLKSAALHHFLRDKQMADNAAWYIEKYKNEKIIINTSTFHISRNLSTLTPKKNYHYDKLKPMGQYLWEKYADEIYSIAFVNYSGISGRKYELAKKVPKKRKGSVEYELNKFGKEYLFLDLKNIDLSCRKLIDNSYMTPTLVESKGDWSNIYEGLFFIKRMEHDNRFFKPYDHSDPLDW
ncbi:MAG: erythromycin esterase family protein [Bacteroidetes bacterium]|nr:erythromycin esterase family protein [Bacteroidota bacterium]